MTLPSWYDSWITDDHYTEVCPRCESKCDELIEVNGAYEQVCSECIELYYVECSHCHNQVDLDAMSNEVDDVCNQCVEDYYCQCPSCNIWFNVELDEGFTEDNNLCAKCREGENHE